MRYTFANNELFRQLCGVADTGIADLEELLDVQLVPRGHSFLIQSDSNDRIRFAVDYFDALSEQYTRQGLNQLDQFDKRYLFNLLKNNPNSENDVEKPELDYAREVVFTTHRGQPIHPRTRRQAEFVQSILQNAVTICIGPAGTGKTFLSIATACRMLVRGEVERLVLTRPAVEAGESLGYLPGDLTQKVDPYLRPIYDSLYECLGYEKVHDLIQSRRIEIAPLAFMRGRTLNDSMTILDEAQNSTIAQLKMFLTRLGRNSHMCLSGDTTQVDLTPPGRSGLARSARMLRSLAGVGVIHFGNADILRNPMVERIVQAFEEELLDESATRSVEREAQ